jgi:hypothetical protein
MSITASQRSYLRTEFAILSDSCPVDQGDPLDCPFHGISGKSLNERLAWFDERSDEVILNIHAYCQMCLEVKEKLGIK